MKRFAGLILLLAFISLGLVNATDSTRSEQNEEKLDEIVVLIHGLGRSNIAMWRLAGRLEDGGYEVHRVGYSSINTTADEVISGITNQINTCCAHDSRTVHFVGHSLGGLLIRAYLQDNRVYRLGRTVFIGTPNNGTEVADQFKDSDLVNFLVPMATELGTDEDSLPSKLAAPYYPVGVIAGVYDSDRNEGYLPGRDDGLVTVESTKIDGMADFIEIESGHSMMRYNKDVAKQVLFFLKQGEFLH